MKNLLALAAVASLFVASAANAAVLSVTSNAAQGIYSALINTGSDVIDTIDVKFTPGAGSTFINNNSGLASGVPRNPGDPFTYPNRKLNADPLDVDGGQGWTFFGLTNNANTLEFTGTPIGSTINTNNTGLFLGNVMLNSPASTGTVTIKGLRLGNEVFNLTENLGAPIPEPATLAMAGLALVGMVAIGRRKA